MPVDLNKGFNMWNRIILETTGYGFTAVNATIFDTDGTGKRVK